MSTATCINLLQVFGRDYKITFDPAYDSRRVPRRCLDPWLMQLPCRARASRSTPSGAAGWPWRWTGGRAWPRNWRPYPGCVRGRSATGRRRSSSTRLSSRRSLPSSGPARGGASRKGNAVRAPGGWPERGRRRPRSDRIGGPGRPRTAAPGLEGHPRPRGRLGAFINTRLGEVLPTPTGHLGATPVAGVPGPAAP
jgi:hypothetical protein